MKRVLITGSRIWEDFELLERTLQALVLELGEYKLVHGGARGVDQYAGKFVRQQLGLPCEVYLADWGRFKNRAGFMRNAEMVRTNPDLCVAFIKDHSAGASMCAQLAEKAGIETRRWIA